MKAAQRELRMDVILAELDKGKRAELERVLRDRTYLTRHICTGLAEWGVTVADNSVSKWRKRNGVI